MRKYNHAIDIAFAVTSSDPNGFDITPGMIRAALLERIAELDKNPDQWLEAAGAPFDTYVMDLESGHEI